jgi:hypothetical protein
MVAGGMLVLPSYMCHGLPAGAHPLPRTLAHGFLRLKLSGMRADKACEGHLPICAYLRPFPPTSPSRHVLLTEAWARSLCQPCPHRAFLMPPTPRPAAQKAA